MLRMVGGKKNGKEVRHLSNGKRLEIDFKDDHKIESRIFGIDGLLCTQTKYKNDVPHGEQFCYNNDGSIKNIFIWDNGKKIGEII